MKGFCVVLDIHQPVRLNQAFPYERAMRIAEGRSVIDRYFDEGLDRELFVEYSKGCCTPTLKVVLETITAAKDGQVDVGFALNLSGLFLEQALKYDSELVELLKKLVETGRVEVLGGTYYHSLASLLPEDLSEFTEQAKQHFDLVKKVLNFTPAVFVNTDYIYNDEVGRVLADAGFDGVLTEGADGILEGMQPTGIYTASGDSQLKVMLRHRGLSEDLDVRFYVKSWSEYPLSPEKYSGWLAATSGQVVLISLDLSRLEESVQSEDSILRFIERLPFEVAKRGGLKWMLPTEAFRGIQPSGALFIPEARTVFKGGSCGDLSHWLGNYMQRVSFNRMGVLRAFVEELGENSVARIWRLLQQSDHLRSMSEAVYTEEAKKRHSQFASPSEAFVVFNSVLTDFEGRLCTVLSSRRRKEQRAAAPPNGSGGYRPPSPQAGYQPHPMKH